MPDWTPEQRRALARFTRPRTRKEQVDADLAHERGLSPEEKDARIQSVVRAAAAILSARPDRDRVLEPDPPAPDFAEIWGRLVAQHRAG